MSKIFEAVSRDSLLDIQDLTDNVADAQQLPEDERETGEPSADKAAPLQALKPPAPREHDMRAASLRVSALAPLFPFFDEAHAAATEQYRIIRTKILHAPKRPRFIVVSSPTSGDGKTTTSINTAASLSLKENMSVLLVDADLRRPMVAELLGIPSTPGIAEVLSGRTTLSSAIIQTQEFPNLCILPAGDSGQSAAELLHSERWPEIIEQLRAQFNIVILDATPVAVVADYELLQHVSDGVIIVVRPDHTDRRACSSALQSVPKDKLLGVVLNGVEDWWLGESYGYGYAYYRKDSKRAARIPVAAPMVVAGTSAE